MEKSELKKKALVIFPLAAVVVGLTLFLPAGSLKYWQAWIFIGVLFLPCIFVVSYFLKHDPALLERRMKYKEKERQQKFIVKLSGVLSFVAFIIPGLDYRYELSHVPVWLVIVSNALVMTGYVIVFSVFKENTYTARTVEVEKGQKVISTGPYALIRHPMYFGVIVMYIFIPTALGSYWALIPFLPTIVLILFRAVNEEHVLRRDLPGYIEYMKKVKYRLIPGIW